MVPALAALAALSLLLGGCWSAAPGEPAPMAELASAEVNPVPREELLDGGTLRWGINEFPRQWNPYHPQGNLSTVATVLEGLLPSPFIVDSEAQAVPDPDYVLDYALESEPEQVLTLTLNPDARWSTGEPVTWRDYAAMAEALGGSGPEYQVVNAVGYDRIADVGPGSDEFEVVIAFDRPYAEFPSLFHPLLPESATASPAAFNEEYRGAIPVTSGPFTVEAIDPTAKTLAVERDAGWWGEPAKLDRVIYRALETGAFEGAFLEGGIDVFALPVDPSSYQRVKSAPDGEVRQALGPEYRHITLNGASPALSEVEVRHAVFLGIDREAMAAAALGGVEWPAEVLNNRFLQPHRVGYQDNSGEWGGYDPERAAELLEAAGWVAPADDPGGIRERDGDPLVLRLAVPRGHGPARDEAGLVQGMLGDIGIEVAIEDVAGDELFASVVLPGNFDLVAFNSTPGAFPVSSTRYQWADAAHGGEWGGNVGRIGDPEIDAALEEALAASDEEEASVHINEADRLLWESGHTLPLYQRPQLVAVRSTLANIGASGLAGVDYADIGFVAE